MKLIVVAALVGAALAAAINWETRPEIIRDRAFQAGKHYTYRFDGQIASGLPSPASQHSATRVQSIVSIVFENDRTALLKMQKIRVGAANKDIVEPREVQPFGLFDETEMTPEQQKTLALPIRFRYEHGLVSEIEFDGEEQTWSANMKRAILNMLQLNMHKKSRTDEAEMSRIVRGNDFELEERRDPENDFFTTQEMTLEGDCETAYTITPAAGENNDDNDGLRVSKSVNFDKCAKRVDIRYNFRFGEECPSCEKKFIGEEQNTESATVLRFRLNGNADEFLIREVELRSHYILSPLAKEHQLMGTFVANKLTLLSVDSEKTAVPKPAGIERKHHLVYSTEWEEKLEQFRMTGEESLIAEQPFPWMEKKLDIARTIVKQLEREIAVEMTEKDAEIEGYTPEANHQIARLVEVLRVCTKEELKKIGRECEKHESLRVLYHDALVLAGTKNTIELVLEKTLAKEITPARAVRHFKQLVNVRNPSEKIVDSLVRFCKDAYVQDKAALKQSCWLTTGALLNGLCGEQRDRLALDATFDNKKAPVCARQTKEKYVTLLEKLFQNANSRYEKILALKTIANAGLDLTVFPLEKIIKNAREEKIVRVQAVEALRRLRTTMPRKIQAVLVPLFKNHREQPEVRVAAFHQVMHTLPERAVIDQITEQLVREPSRQVAAFVFTALKAYARSEIPCEKDMARDIEHSLKLARVPARKTLDSGLGRATLYSDKFYTGASLNWASLFTADSVLPKELMASLETVFSGEWKKYFAQIGFQQHNVDAILYKYLEQLEQSDRDSLDDVIVRGKRSATLAKPAEALKQLMKKMNIKERRFTSGSSDEAHAMIYFRYADLDYAFVPLEEKTIVSVAKDFLRGGKIDIAEIERVLAKGYRFHLEGASFVYERTRMIPTTLGMPVEITGKLPTVLSLRGELKAEIEPKNGNGFDGLRLRLNAEPKLATTHLIHMEVRSPFLSQGVKLIHSAYLNAPLNMEIEMNWEQNFDIKIAVKAPEMPQGEQEQRMVVLHSRPVTYVRFESNERKMLSAVEKTVYVPEQPIMELEKVYGEQVLGMRVNVRGNVHRHLMAEIQNGKTLPICENHLEISMEKTEETPREYVLRLNVAAFDEEEKMTETPAEFERFFDKHTESHFEVEDSEYLNEQEPARRGAFAKYVKEYRTAGKGGYKHRMHVKLETVGSRTERRGQMEIRTTCDREMTYCKWAVEASRTPLLEGERRQWELSATVETLFPEAVQTLKQLHEQKHREAHAIIVAKWGADHTNDIKLKLQAEQSKEQQKWQALTIRRYDEKQALNEEQRAQPEIESIEKLELASRLNQIKIAADYDIQPETLVQIARISALLKAWKPFTAVVEPRNLEKTYQKEGRLLAKITVEPQTWRYANLSIETPAEKMILESIRLPFRPTWLSIEKTSGRDQQPMQRITRRLSGEPVCEVSSKKVNTFDEVIYRAPITTCYSVLAKDCTEEPAFAVLMKKTEKKGEEKKMKIVTEEVTVEAELKKNGKMVVKVNGQEMKEEQKLKEFGIEKVDEELVIFENDDIRVRFDGFKAEIKMSEMFKNKQCGLCGHYDGERDGEFRRADNEETEDMEEFHRSFLSRDDECQMEEETLKEKKNYKKFENEFESSEESDYEFSPFEQKKNSDKKNIKKHPKFVQDETVEPEEKTRVIEYSNRVCFSKKPVPECPRKSFEIESETEEKTVKFACLERSSYEARRLLREAQTDFVEVEHLKDSFAETITIPRLCSVY